MTVKEAMTHICTEKHTTILYSFSLRKIVYERNIAGVSYLFPLKIKTKIQKHSHKIRNEEATASTARTERRERPKMAKEKKKT